jgi:GMP reductase
MMESDNGAPSGCWDLIFPTIGIKEPFGMIQKLYDALHFKGLVIDVPNAYIPNAVARVKEAAKRFPDAFIIAGNVVTSEHTYTLLEAGAHAVKVGIGNGSCCLTRKLTNCGRPQASAVIDCANAAHNLHKFIISDGGCKNEGHIATAFCCGADFVMTGSMFMGCDEMESDTIEVDGKKFKIAMGSSSKRAQDLVFGGMAKYRASEGREVLVPCKGPLQDTLDAIFGGLRSAGTYIGSHTLKDFNKHANFYRVRRTLNTLFAGNQSVA